MTSEFPDLVELHRWLAALTNPACHWDLCQFPEVERIAAIEGVKEIIECELAYREFISAWDRSA